MVKISKAIFKNSNKYLLLKRSINSKSFPGLWDFAGGKYNKGETPTESLIREVKEETTFIIEPGLELKQFQYKKDNWNLIFYYFEPKVLKGKLKLSNEHSEYKWFTPKEMSILDLHPSVALFFSIRS